MCCCRIENSSVGQSEIECRFVIHYSLVRLFRVKRVHIACIRVLRLILRLQLFAFDAVIDRIFIALSLSLRFVFSCAQCNKKKNETTRSVNKINKQKREKWDSRKKVSEQTSNDDNNNDSCNNKLKELKTHNIIMHWNWGGHKLCAV